MDSLLKLELSLGKVRRHTGRKGINWMFCCPWHGENRPSCGLVLMDDGSAIGQCYTCEETFSLPKLYAHVKNITIQDAIEELEEKYRSEIRTDIHGLNKVKRYEDIEDEQHERARSRTELPKVKLAPYRSGKETHQYFFDRGFDEKDMEIHKIGWDKVRKRITIPFFHMDGTLSGFSGRAVLEQKLPSGKLSQNYIKHYGNEPKYYLYNNVPIGELMYGSHNFPEGNDTAILVEGLFDRIWMFKQGFENSLATIIAKMTVLRDGGSPQKDILHAMGIKKVVLFLDNDQAGDVGRKIAYELLKDDFIVLDAKYPEGYNDVLGDAERPPMTKKQIDQCIKIAKPFGTKKLQRI